MATLTAMQTATIQHKDASLYSSEELLLAGRLEDVRGGELEELDSEAGPLLGAVGDQEELVALVH